MLLVLLFVVIPLLLIAGAEIYLHSVTPNFHFEDPPKETLDHLLRDRPLTIVLLGAGIKTDQPILSDRLHCAEEAFRRWPHAKVFVSGNNIDSTEVDAMKAALMRRAQIPEPALVLDGDAKNTRDTFRNLRKHMDQIQNVLICTNEFHQRRSVALANSFGFQAWAYGRDRTRYSSATALFGRERLSRLKWMFESLLQE